MSFYTVAVMNNGGRSTEILLKVTLSKNYQLNVPNESMYMQTTCYCRHIVCAFLVFLAFHNIWHV